MNMLDEHVVKGSVVVPVMKVDYDTSFSHCKCYSSNLTISFVS